MWSGLVPGSIDLLGKFAVFSPEEKKRPKLLRLTSHRYTKKIKKIKSPHAGSGNFLSGLWEIEGRLRERKKRALVSKQKERENGSGNRCVLIRSRRNDGGNPRFPEERE